MFLEINCATRKKVLYIFLLEEIYYVINMVFHLPTTLVSQYKNKKLYSSSTALVHK